MTPPLKIIIEKYASVYVAYPLGLRNGAIVGQGDTYEEALADVRSAIRFHQETFGVGSLALDEDDPLLDVFVDEAEVPAAASEIMQSLSLGQHA